jgi:hypothetical protein
MANLILNGSTSGSVTLSSPAVSGTNTLTLPASTGTVILSDASANLQFNSGYGSVATAYGCRAWVNFNGTGTPAIRGSGNVSSITDNGTGDYTLNFTTALPDTNYSIVGSCGRADDKNNYVLGSKTNTTSSAFVFTNNSSGGVLYANQKGDFEFVSAAVFR